MTVVAPIQKEPSTASERKALLNIIERMTPFQRCLLVSQCADKAISFGKVYQKGEGLGTAKTTWDDLKSLVVLYRVSWETINLTAEAIIKGKLSWR